MSKEIIKDRLVRLESIDKVYKAFLSKYEKKYSESALNYIKEHFYEFINDLDAPDILLQLYTEFGILGDNNRYQEYLNMLEKNFDIRGNILEVGGGFIPSFASLLASKQLKLNSGTITVYDPNLIIESPKYKNITLVKDEVNSNFDVSKFDTIVGIMPCSAYETILNLACKNKKNFFLAMCGCFHFDFYNSMIYGNKNYSKYVIDLAKSLLKEYNNGELHIEKLNDNFNIDYPILYNKKS